jgi:nitroimidazol reductase NimA-like FMN-containing flavoprotein (pyridoxamine 5'-phosphate oxidase superfamily)
MLDVTTEWGQHAERRLRSDIIAWLTTVGSDGRPYTVPVWFLWDGETILLFSQPQKQ